MTATTTAATTAATFTTTAAMAAQFLTIGDVVEVRGVLLEVVSDRYFTLAGVQYAVRNLETLEGGVAEFPLGVMLPLYERG